jgi:hypothetical protein
MADIPAWCRYRQQPGHAGGQAIPISSSAGRFSVLNYDLILSLDLAALALIFTVAAFGWRLRLFNAWHAQSIAPLPKATCLGVFYAFTLGMALGEEAPAAWDRYLQVASTWASSWAVIRFSPGFNSYWSPGGRCSPWGCSGCLLAGFIEFRRA